MKHLSQCCFSKLEQLYIYIYIYIYISTEAGSTWCQNRMFICCRYCSKYLLDFINCAGNLYRNDISIRTFSKIVHFSKQVLLCTMSSIILLNKQNHCSFHLILYSYIVSYNFTLNAMCNINLVEWCLAVKRSII